MANKPDDNDRHVRIRARVREMLSQYEDEVEDIQLEGTDWTIQLVDDEVARVYETETEEDIAYIVELSDDEVEEIRERTGDDNIDVWLVEFVNTSEEYNAVFPSWEVVYGYVLGIGTAQRQHSKKH
jgi:hypothetical protein